MSFTSQNKYAACLSSALAILSVMTSSAGATDVTANAVMEKMPADERAPYIAGVVEGVAFGRYLAGGKKVEILDCIYDWFTGKPNAYDTIYVAFGRYSCLAINGQGLVGSFCALIAWWAWPVSADWAVMAFPSVLFGIVALIAFWNMFRAMLAIYERERAAAEFEALGPAPKSARLASDDLLDRLNMFDEEMFDDR
ncbi:hypothetical protein [Methylocella sp.]|uniref:hypothetical protein n=1 Tax=Methylocella sp. TaxID=1978226 RepID=UPI0037830CA9